MRDKNQRDWPKIAEILDRISTDRAQQWVMGVGIPALIALYSVFCCLSQRALFLGARPVRIVELHGASATAIGVMYFAAALFMHCHWYWSSHPEYHGYAELGKTVCMMGGVGGLGYYAYNVLILG